MLRQLDRRLIATAQSLYDWLWDTTGLLLGDLMMLCLLGQVPEIVDTMRTDTERGAWISVGVSILGCVVSVSWALRRRALQASGLLGAANREADHIAHSGIYTALRWMILIVAGGVSPIAATQGHPLQILNWFGVVYWYLLCVRLRERRLSESRDLAPAPSAA